jgi:APA family basic amino acid/polyamine antiporter
MKKNLNVWTLAGFLVGPVLGSGVVLLPPLALEKAGAGAFSAWAVTLVLMGVFAGVCAALALRFPGDGGLTAAVGAAFGDRYRTLCGRLLAGAVCFGPAAVLLMAGEFLGEIVPQFGGGAAGAGLFLALCVALLLRRVSFAGMLALVCSTVIGAGFLCGSLSVLFFREGAAALALPAPSPAAFGETLVLLFWAVIGWEILGNYTLEIESPKRSIPLAAGIAFCAICAVYLAIAAALPRIGAGGTIPSMTDLLTPLFGSFASPLLAVCGILLCVCTYLMVVGGVSRLVASMAERGELPRMLALRNKEGAPYRAIAALGCVHGAGLLLSSLSVLDVASLVGIANGLFLLNSLLAVAAAARLLRSPAVRTASAVLAACFLILFALADRTALLVSVTVLLFSLKEASQGDRVAVSG